MAKVDISPEMGQRLREFRLRSGIRAKELAQYIGKTPAYITKLEKGDFKTVDEAALQKIVTYITGDKNGYERFIDDFLSDVSDAEVAEQLEIMHFDMLERVIPVPASLVSYINAQLKELDLGIGALVEYINQNDDYDDAQLAQYGLSRSAMKFNCFYPISDNSDSSSTTKTVILYKLTESKVRSILNGRTKACPHMILFAIVYNLLKLQHNGPLSDAERWQLKSETSRILTENKFYTILDRSRYFSSSPVQSEYKAFLNAYDQENFRLINELFEQLEFLSNYNVVYTNEKLLEVAENFNKDASFALSFMALPVSKLSQMTVTQKKAFLEAVRELIEDSLSMAGNHPSVELY